MRDLVATFRELFIAPYPYVWITTFEEERAHALVKKVASELDRELRVWRPDDHDHPIAALDEELREISIRHARGEVHLLFDIHPLMEDPWRVRALRALGRTLESRGSTVVFVAPTTCVPAELARDVVTVDLPLPDQSALAKVARKRIPPNRLSATLVDRISAAALGLTTREAIRAFDRARIALDDGLAGGDHAIEALVVEEKRRLMHGASALEFCSIDRELEDVGGLGELKIWVRQRERAFGREARAFGLPAPKGLLLVGVQGCGKSLAARAVAGEWGIPLLRLDPGALFSGGVPPDDALRVALRTSEVAAPCVLWVDEIEKGFGALQDPETERLLGSLLTWLQEKTEPVFFVATANRVEGLPPELLRRGRFDEVFFVDLPAAAEREKILAIHLRQRRRDPSAFDLAEIAERAEHFSGAELEQVVNDALYRAFAGDRDLTDRDLEIAATQLVPLYATFETQIKALRTWARGRARPAARDEKLADMFRGGAPQS